MHFTGLTWPCAGTQTPPGHEYLQLHVWRHARTDPLKVTKSGTQPREHDCIVRRPLSCKTFYSIHRDSTSPKTLQKRIYFIVNYVHLPWRDTVYQEIICHFDANDKWCYILKSEGGQFEDRQRNLLPKEKNVI